MISTNSYDIPTSRQSLVSESKGRKVCMYLVPVILPLAILTAVVITNLQSPPKYAAKNETSSSTSDNLRLRLPRSVKPISYKIQLIPHLEDEIRKFPIDGKIWIRILCLEETATITFHMKNITVDRNSVEVKKTSVVAESITVLDQILDSEKDFYTLTLGGKLNAGEEYIIYLAFQSLLRDDLTGFYRSSYMDPDTNEKIWLAVTQFEPTDARKAFPCFDEPELKAEFKISLARPGNMTTISNMNILSTEPVPEIPNWFWDHYDRSLPMSTYLVAFIISNFTYRESYFKNEKTGEMKPFRVWSRHATFNQTNYAVEIGTKIITYYENYFGVQFPLPKMDLVAIPDFKSAAMENWGMVTFKESEILYVPHVTPVNAKDRIVSTISHELAHQWFGDLVTPKWWSDLWLNEGFATYMEYIGTNFVEPTWRKLEFMITDEIHYVFCQDVLESSHPVSVSVNDPNEINEIFDEILYDKGASIIRMMNHFLTPKTLQNGLKRYFEKWKYSSTVQKNLWDSFTEQGQNDGTLQKNITVDKIMDTWTLQTGFPVVNVQRNYGQGSANFTQEKFRLFKNLSSSDSDPRKWWIPISYATPGFNSDFNKTTPEFWISNSESTKKASISGTLADDDWLIVNIQETGFFRVNYDAHNWNLISNQLKINPNIIGVANRAQIIDDSLNLARASQLPYENVMNLTTYLANNENEFLPWKAFFNGIYFISKMIDENQNPEAQFYFNLYIGNLVLNQYKLVGFEEGKSDTLMDQLHRSTIISLACQVNHSDCLQKSREYFAEWVKQANPDKENPLPLNLRKEIYCSVIKYSSKKVWNFLFQRYLLENVPSAKKQLIQGLSCSNNATILKRFVNMTLTPNSGVPKHDTEVILKEIARNPIGAEIIFEILKTRWEYVESYTNAFLGNILRIIGDKFNTKNQLFELLSLKKLRKSTIGTAARALDETIEKVEGNINWMAKNFEDVVKYLKRHYLEQELSQM